MWRVLFEDLDLIRPGKRLCSIKARTSQPRSSFFPEAVRLMNTHTNCFQFFPMCNIFFCSFFFLLNVRCEFILTYLPAVWLDFLSPSDLGHFLSLLWPHTGIWSSWPLVRCWVWWKCICWDSRYTWQCCYTSAVPSGTGPQVRMRLLWGQIQRHFTYI